MRLTTRRRFIENRLSTEQREGTKGERVKVNSKLSRYPLPLAVYTFPSPLPLIPSRSPSPSAWLSINFFVSIEPRSLRYNTNYPPLHNANGAPRHPARALATRFQRQA